MTKRDTPQRRPLNRERVIGAAVALADRDGLDALTMRQLGSELGVEAMSLYKHVANKDEILDAMVDSVISEIALPTEDAGWKDAMRDRATSARKVFTQHPWALGLMESRRPEGPAVLQYLDRILGSLRSAGFSIDDSVHAFFLLDTFVYGHVIQELTLSSESESEDGGFDPEMVASIPADVFPHLSEMMKHAAEHEFSVDEEFEFGLDLFLDALEQSLVQSLSR